MGVTKVVPLVKIAASQGKVPNDLKCIWIHLCGLVTSFTRETTTVELQWLKHGWLIYHGYFELVLESPGKNPIAADIIVFGIILDDFLFYIDTCMLCGLIRIASIRGF